MSRPNRGSASAESNKNGTRKRVRIATMFVLGLSVWAAITAWNQMGTLQDNAGRLKVLQTKLDATSHMNDSLKKEINRLNDPEYREEKARKELHMSKDGETVFDVPGSNP